MTTEWRSGGGEPGGRGFDFRNWETFVTMNDFKCLGVFQYTVFTIYVYLILKEKELFFCMLRLLKYLKLRNAF